MEVLKGRSSNLDWVKNKTVARIIVFFAIGITVVDSVYMSVFGIHQQNRELCVLYSSMPRWLFLCYEYFFEFGLVVGCSLG